MAGLEYSARISAKSLTDLYKDAKAAPGVMQIELRRGIKKAGEQVRVAVADSAATFSKQIPPKIKTKVSFAARGATVKIVADDPSGEAAALNNRNKAGTFRHPVFANPLGERDIRTRAAIRRILSGQSNIKHTWVWVDQVAHPFFVSSAHPAALQAADEIRKVMDDVAHKLGFI